MPDSRVIPSLLYNDFIVQPLRGRGFSCWFRPGPGTPKKPRCCKTRSFSSLNFPLSFGDPTPAGNLEAMEVWHLGCFTLKVWFAPFFLILRTTLKWNIVFQRLPFKIPSVVIWGHVIFSSILLTQPVLGPCPLARLLCEHFSQIKHGFASVGKNKENKIIDCGFVMRSTFYMIVQNELTIIDLCFCALLITWF